MSSHLWIPCRQATHPGPTSTSRLSADRPHGSTCRDLYKWVSSNQSQQPEIRAPSNLLASPSATTPAAGVSVVHNNNGRDSLDLAFPSAPSPLQEHSCREARGGFSQLICGSPVRERREQDPGWRAKRRGLTKQIREEDCLQRSAEICHREKRRKRVFVRQATVHEYMKKQQQQQKKMQQPATTTNMVE